MVRSLRSSIASVSVAALIAGAAPGDPPAFELTLLTWERDGEVTVHDQPAALNAHGHVVGWSVYEDAFGDFPETLAHWTADDGLDLTLDPDGARLRGTGINDSDVLVGWGGPFDAAFVVQDGVFEWLTGSSYTIGFPAAINDAGVVVGAGQANDDPRHVLPLRWSGGEPEMLPLPAWVVTGRAESINAHGVIVGSVHETAFGLSGHGAIWDGEALTVLTLLSGDARSDALDINDQNVVVGQYKSDVTEPGRAARWVRNDVSGMWERTDLALDLPPRDADRASRAIAINEDGTILITFGIFGDGYLWTDGVVTPINNESLETGVQHVTLTSVIDLNDAGQVLIDVEYPAAGGGGRAAILTPIEPCPADLDGDDTVGFADVLALLSNWGNAGTGDVDADGIVGFGDLLVLLSAWGAC